MTSNQQLAIKQNVDTVRAALEQMKPQLALALPTHLTPERLLRVTMTAVQNNPRLLDCDRTSLFAAVMTSAQLGLEPDGALGQAYLVPFKNKVQFIPGYKGYLTLARNSGEVSTVQAHEVCARDHFEYAYGLNERLEHVPADGERGNITYFYAYSKYKDGGHIFEVMTRAEIDAIRDNSEAFRAFKAKKIKSTPWDSDYVQMGRKTAIRRLANYLPLSVQRAAVLDAAHERGKHADIDQFGDIVIDGQASEVADSAQTGATGATAKLDQLAGTASATNGEEKPEVSDKPPNMTQLKKAIKAATTVEDVNLQVDLSRHLSEDHRNKVSAVGKARIDELMKDAQRHVSEPSQIPEGDGGSLFGDE